MSNQISNNDALIQRHNEAALAVHEAVSLLLSRIEQLEAVKTEVSRLPVKSQQAINGLVIDRGLDVPTFRHAIESANKSYFTSRP